MPKTSKPAPHRHDIECEVDGKTHHGHYKISNGTMTVSWPYGSKSATPSSNPEVIAKLILAELVAEAKRKNLIG